jgi:hypothetical protein
LVRARLLVPQTFGDPSPHAAANGPVDPQTGGATLLLSET